MSVEFFELVRQRLTPNGSVFINTNMNDIHPSALRAAAGIAAFTTIEVPAERASYRPFTDRWSASYRLASLLFSSIMNEGVTAMRTTTRARSSR